jgi:DNA-binding LacI/PurR family transcriptional regulator
MTGPTRGTIVALYAQLIAHFRDQIRDGSLPAGSRLPTELELAERFNVSRGTVRQAMTTLVNEGLVERVQGRGTFVRLLADSSPGEVQSQASEKRIGLLLSYPSSELDLDLLVGVEHAAKARGYAVSFVYTEERAEEQTRDIAWLLSHRVLGLIIYPLSNIGYDESIWRLRADGMPFVLIDRYFPDLDSDYVVSDNVGGGYRATEHLIILGHTRIAFVYSSYGNLSTTSVRDRLEGYRRALREYGLPYDESLLFQMATASKNDPHGPHEPFLMSANRPTAVLVTTDNEAIALMQSAKRFGVNVPDDLALVGFDNLRLSRYVHPPLTTVAQSCRDEGVRAVNLLINRIEGQAGPHQHIELPTSLIVRESCGARLHIQKSVKNV